MSFLKHALFTLLLTALVGVAVAAWVIVGGRFDVAVSAQLPQPVHQLIHQTRVNAVRRKTRHLQPQVADLNDDKVMFGAVIGFQSMCADCHHPPGGQPSALAQGLNPPPADLSESANKRSIQELFWVTRHGIRMSGMPAWGATHEDSELWALATLITRFPELSANDYQHLLTMAREAGVEHAHDHGESADKSHEHHQH